MEILNSLDPTTLDRLQKFSAQLSTAMRTFSKLVVSLQKFGTKSSDYGLDHELDESLEEWIFSPMCRWGKNHAEDVATWFLGGRYRADRCKNTWKLEGNDVENRHGWKKIPNSELDMLYETYCDIVEESKDCVESAKHLGNSLWKRVRPGKRVRAENITRSTPVSMKEFVEVMKERHLALPALRSLNIPCM